MATNTPTAPEKPADFQKQVKDVESWIRYWRRRFKPQDGSAAFSPAMMNQQKQLQKQNLDVLKQLLQNQTQKSQVVFVKNEYNHEKLDPTEIKKRMEFDRSVSKELNNLLDDIRGSLFDVNSEVEFDTRLNHIREEKLENLLELQRQLTEVKTEDELSGPYLKQIAGSIARINATLKETQDALIKKQNLGQTNQPKINITLGNSEPFPSSPNAMAGYSMANASSDSLGLIGAAAMSFVFLRHFSEMVKGIGKKFSQSNKLAAFGSAKLFTNTGQMLGNLADFMSKSVRFPSMKKWVVELLKKIKNTSFIKGIIKYKNPYLIGLAGAGIVKYIDGVSSFSEYLDETFDPEKSKSPLVKLLFLDQVKAVKLGGNDGEALLQMFKVFTLTKGLLFGDEIGKAIRKGYMNRKIVKELFKDKAFIKDFSKPTLKKVWQTLSGTREYADEAFETKNIEKFKAKLNEQIGKLKAMKAFEINKQNKENLARQIKSKEKFLKNLDKRINEYKNNLKKFYDAHEIKKTIPPKGLLEKLGRCCKFIGKAFKKIPWLNGGFLIYEYIRYVRQNPKKQIDYWNDNFDTKYPDLAGMGFKEKILKNMALVYEWWLTDLKFQLGILTVNFVSTLLGPVGFLTVGAVTTLADILFTKFRDWRLGFKMADCDFDNPLTFINPKEIIKYKGIAYAQKQNIKIDQDVLDEAYGDAGVIVIDAETKNIDFKSNKISLSSDDFSLSWWKLSYFAKTQAEKLANFSTYALVRYLSIDKGMGTFDFLDFSHRMISFETSIDLGEYSFTLPGFTDNFLYSDTEFAHNNWKAFTDSTPDFIKKLMSSFGALRFLIVLFEDKKYLNSLFSYPGLKLGFTRMDIIQGKMLDRFNVEATSYDFLKIFNVKAQIPIPKKLKEWLPRAIFAFYCASVFAYGKARVFTDKESEKDKVFADNEKLIYAVAKYFIKDYEKLIPLLKERAKTDFSKDSDGVVTLDFKNIKDADITKTGNISTVEKTSTNVSAESLAIFEASKDFIEKVEKASPEEKRKLRRDNIAAHVAQKLHETYGGFSFGYLIPALTEHVIMKYNFNDLNTKKDIENAVNKAIEDLKEIFPDNKTFGEASKTFLSFDESKTFFNNNETFNISTENLKLLTSYSENISNYKNVIPKDSSAANIGKPNTTPDSTPYQADNADVSAAPSASPNETEFVGAAPEIKSTGEIWIQGKKGKINPFQNTVSNGYCARGAKTILTKMFGFPYFAGNATDVPSDIRFKEHFAQIQKPASFQNGDVYVIRAFPGHQYGHMAVYVNGSWYSDFKQQRENVYRRAGLKDSYIAGLTSYYRPKKYLNGAPTVKISGVPSSSYNASVSKPESNVSEYEGKLNGNENQKEKKTEAVVVKAQEKKNSQPVNTHGMAEELFLIKIDNLGFVC